MSKELGYAPYRHLNPDIQAEVDGKIVYRYRHGATVRELAEYYGTSTQRITAILDARNVKRRPARPRKRDSTRIIERLWSEGKSMQAILKETDLPYSTVYRTIYRMPKNTRNN